MALPDEDSVATFSNPYAAPAAPDPLPEPPRDFAAIRRHLLGTEVSLRLLGVLLLGWATMMARDFDLDLAKLQQAPRAWLVEKAILVLLPLALGLSLIPLLPLARIIGTLLIVAISLSGGGCFGAIAAAVLFFLLHMGEATLVLAHPHAEVRRATPEQNRWFWIALAVVTIAVAIFYAAIDALDSAGSAPGTALF